MLKRRLSSVVGLVPVLATCLLACQVLAADPPGPKVDRFRGFLIYEDTGDLSKNVAKQSDQIIANDEKGTGTQIIVDVIVTGPKNQTYENAPFLYVVVNSLTANQGDPPMVDTGYPINFIGNTGQIVRSLVVEHNCNGFTIDAYTMVGDKKLSELKKTFNITCGD